METEPLVLGQTGFTVALASYPAVAHVPLQIVLGWLVLQPDNPTINSLSCTHSNTICSIYEATGWQQITGRVRWCALKQFVGWKNERRITTRMRLDCFCAVTSGAFANRLWFTICCGQKLDVSIGSQIKEIKNPCQIKPLRKMWPCVKPCVKCKNITH